jgi:hypothetical protein
MWQSHIYGMIKAHCHDAPHPAGTGPLCGRIMPIKFHLLIKYMNNFLEAICKSDAGAACAGRRIHVLAAGQICGRIVLHPF